MTGAESDPKIVDRSLTRFSPERAYPGRYREQFHELVRSEVEGAVLDVGSGGGGTHDRWRFPNAREVYTTDVEDYDGLDVRADGAKLPFEGEVFDCVVCSAVFEHVPMSKFGTVVEEIHRVLKPGGRLYAAVAFNYPLHGQPHDYFRPTIHGLEEVAERTGFEIELLYRGGSYVDTLLHVLFSPIRRTCMFFGMKPLSGLFALVHYPALALARLVSFLLVEGYGENPFGSRWYLMNGIVARRAN